MNQSRKYKWKCKKCDGRIFKTSTLLKRHKKQEHAQKAETDLQYNYTFNNQLNAYTCNTCDLEYPEKEDVEKHVLEHVEKYTCQICSEQFFELYKYSVHISKHNGSDEQQCGGCDYKTKSITNLLSHIKSKHLSQYKYNCAVCKKWFNDRTKYIEHCTWHKTGNNFECVVCKKVFPYSSYLSVHQIRNHKVFIEGELAPNQCPTCKKIFAKQGSLERHQLRHVKKKEPHKKVHLCDICGKGFAVKGKLTEHYRDHTGEKPYKCNYCEKCFARSYYLKLHERIHSGERPYVCGFCGKAFNQGAPLRIHQRIHTGDKPFSCTHCDKKFISKGALSVHLKQCSYEELFR